MTGTEDIKRRAGGPLGDEHVRPVNPPAAGTPASATSPGYPLSAIVGQDDLIQALLVCAVNPIVGGVLVRGERGTAKSTAVRALAPMLGGPVTGLEATGNPAVPLVELPLGATLDRLVGTLDLRAAMGGEHRVEPGLLARAHGGVLYVDEVNLLGDHLVDALLDAAASGVVTVERDGVSVAQDARFLLVGTMNPEEGDLRPQLLDRFGLGVEIAGPRDPKQRAGIVARRMSFDEDPVGFAAEWAEHEAALAARIAEARSRLQHVFLPESELLRISTVCASLDLDGVRGDLVCAHAARAIAALEGATTVDAGHVSKAAHLALRHRMRRDPLAPPPPGGRDQAIDDALDEARDAGGDQSGDTPPADTDSTPPDTQPDIRGSEDDSGGGEPPEGSPPLDGDAETERSPSDNPNPQPETEWQPSSELAPPPRSPRENAPSPGRPSRVRPTAVPSRIAESALRLDRTARRGPSSRPDLNLQVPPGRSPGGRLAVVDARPAREADPIAILPTILAALRGDDRPQTAITGGGRGALLCLIVDTSGSMAAQRRLARVKGALEAALRRAYARRDLVAVVAFSGDGAETLVAPGTPIEFAARAVHALPAGGRTPLAAGIAHGAALLEDAARSNSLGGRARIAVLLTDGRADDRAGHARTALRRVVAAADRTVVVDLDDGRARLGRAADLAASAGADLTRLVAPSVAAGPSRPAA